ncbi:MAG: protein kinase [Pirellulales bacterium]|nr:protein kinase [Pirellulales bacterium]
MGDRQQSDELRVPPDAGVVPADALAPILERFRTSTSPALWEYLKGLDEPLSAHADQRRCIGRFEIVRCIGEGGFGKVFEAYDPDNDRKVALKVPSADTLLDSERVRRFVREAQIGARLRHPNVVSVLEVDTDGVVVFLVMELCRGPDLARWLATRDGRVDVDTALEILLPIVDVVALAHRQAIVHRDIKPSNILLDLAGDSRDSKSPPRAFTPRLSDFGLAKLLDGESSRHTQSGVAVGTPSYMPPEQADRRLGEIGPWSDVYALGIVLFELLCGQSPFQGKTPGETARFVLARHVQLPRSVRREIPRSLEAICLHCLETAPRDRYQTAGELQDDLRLALARKRTRAQARRGWTGPGRRQWRAAAAGLLLAAVAVVLGAFWVREAEVALPVPADDKVATSLAMAHMLSGDRRPMLERIGRLQQPAGVAGDDAIDAAGALNRIATWVDSDTGKKHVYQLVYMYQQVTWEDARDLAAASAYQGKPGHLASITSPSEATFIRKELLAPALKAGHGRDVDNVEAWIGLVRDKASGDFRWVTGEKFEFSVWGNAEPSNGDTEDCASVALRWGISSHYGDWNDYNHASPFVRFFLIEYEL